LGNYDDFKFIEATEWRNNSILIEICNSACKKRY
jgi:hypothetical protein